jgi:3-hydroxymyristoyl/3-hydroxydecanoyl-(acyl carrier protein) dehydratase
MKKIVMIVTVALFGAVVLPSCKKDYTCTCTIGGASNATKMSGTKKSDAQAACDASNVAAQKLGGTCSLD